MNESREYDPRHVAERLLAIRRAHDLSQVKFANECGVSATALANWEQGRQRPSIEAAKKIVDRFDLTLDYLLLGRTGTLKRDIA